MALSGTVSGLAANSTFNVTVTDNGVIKTYVATVNGTATGWTATIPSTDATALANGTATIAATVTDANGNQASASQTVTVAETGPTVTIAADPTTDITIGPSVGGQVPYVAGLTDGGYAVAWTQYNSSVGSWETYVQVVHNGVLSAPYAIASSAIAGDGELRDPYVAATASGFLVGWFQGSNNSQYGLNFNNEGTAVGSPFLLAPSTDEEVNGTLAAYTSGPYAGQIVNAWEQTSGGINDVNDILVSINGAAPFTANILGAGAQGTGQPHGAQITPSIATLSNGNFVVTWTDTNVGGPAGSDLTSTDEVYADLFSANGTRIGTTDIHVNTATAGNQFDSHVAALPNGGFVITWIDNSNIKAQIFDATGAEIGTEILVSNNHSAITAGQPLNTESSVAALANGVFLVVWQADPAGHGNELIYGQMFDASGNTIGAQITISSAASSGQEMPTVSAIPGTSNFVVAWFNSVSGQVVSTIVPYVSNVVTN